MSERISAAFRLHNLAEDKPLVLSEFGVDSIREGEAETLAKVVVKLRDGSGRNSSLSDRRVVYWRVCHPGLGFWPS